MNGIVISGPKRFLYGGLGSLLPTLYALAMGRDFENIFAHPTWALVLGWLVRTAALFAIGGLTVIFLKRNLKSISMIFLTGVVAPGIVRAVVSQDGAAVFTPPQAEAKTEAAEAGRLEEPAARAAAPAPAPAPPPAGEQPHVLRHALTRDRGPASAGRSEPPPPPPPAVQSKPKPQPVQSKTKSPMKSFLMALRG